MNIPKIYLSNPKATLDYPGLQGFKLAGYEKYKIPAGATIEEIYALLDTLDVEHSARYQPTKGATHCDCYAGDYCLCRGVYLPSGVFWNNTILWNAKMSQDYQFPQKAIIAPVGAGGTVRELNANALYDWLLNYGKDFGWSEISNFSNLQSLANNGAVCIMVGKTVTAGKPGHIVVVIPEFPKKAAVAFRDNDGCVVCPVTSEAGGKCIKISIGDKWFLNEQFGGQVKLWCNNII